MSAEGSGGAGEDGGVGVCGRACAKMSRNGEYVGERRGVAKGQQIYTAFRASFAAGRQNA